MITVLIIEDSPKDTLEIQLAIKAAFPGAVIEEAASVEKAHNEILALRKRGAEFDFVIADVVVPFRPGEKLPHHNSPEWDLMVSDVERRRTKLILTSSRVSGDLHDVTIIPKSDVGWIRRIVNATAGHVISESIEEAFGKQLGTSFGEEPDSPRGMGTIPVGRLIRNLYLLWPFLDQPARERVRRYFDVIESPDNPDEVVSVNFGGRK